MAGKSSTCHAGSIWAESDAGPANPGEFFAASLTAMSAEPIQQRRGSGLPRRFNSL
jgi:hypothetical protein